MAPHIGDDGVETFSEEEVEDREASGESILTDQEVEQMQDPDSPVAIRYPKPSSLVGAINSHAIWSAAALDACDFDTSMVRTFTYEQIEQQMGSRGFGGELPDRDAGPFINGWTTAEDLARHYLDEYPAGGLSGRGFIARACLRALVMAGE